jgi:hypothetical protein
VGFRIKKLLPIIIEKRANPNFVLHPNSHNFRRIKPFYSIDAEKATVGMIVRRRYK